MDLRLLQREVAERLGVSPDTVKNWEAERTEPAIQYVPRILDFLGSFILPEAETALDFPARLTLARRVLGLTQKQLGERFGVDESTIWEWENGNHRPIRRHWKRVAVLFACASDPGSSRPSMYQAYEWIVDQSLDPKLRDLLHTLRRGVRPLRSLLLGGPHEYAPWPADGAAEKELDDSFLPRCRAGFSTTRLQEGSKWARPTVAVESDLDPETGILTASRVGTYPAAG